MDFIRETDCDEIMKQFTIIGLFTFSHFLQYMQVLVRPSMFIILYV